ncbi:MAG: TRAP transporter substrate-binding protein DctP [Alphaproteobacteria bacterium]|nr:TRAP transporter substrate-binding protein DctP [Alphaproteobacteria bacterium]
MRWLAVAAIVASCVSGAAGPTARAQAPAHREFRLSVVATRPVPIAEGAYRWSEKVAAATSGRVAIKVYPASSLVGGDQSRELLALRQGGIDMLVASTINLSPTIRAMNLFSLPFLLPDARAFDAVVAGPAGRALFAALESFEAVPLAWGDNGFRQISNARHAIRGPADLHGLKIRYAASPIFAEILAALGANPTQMSFADLQPALSTGAVDGQENSVPLFHALKMDQLAQRHLTLWNYVSDAAIFVVRRTVWQELSVAEQDALRDAAQAAGREMTALARAGLGPDDPILGELAARGVAVVRLDAREAAAFHAATRPVYEKWRAVVGPDLVSAAEASVAGSR